ncbi:MAG: hypothetical protein E7568_06720 [Ruminococcaceae bacterium]|nr:hypothetical protein [Oscillospiraceae bacterium]
MKKIFAVLALLLFCFTLAGCNAKSEINYKKGDELSYCTEGNVTESFAEKLGQSEEKLSELMKDSGIIFYGISKDKGYIVTVFRQKTEFSERITDLSYVSNTALHSIAMEISPDYIDIYESNEAVYIIQDTTGLNSENEHPALQYITVKKGNLYIVTFNFSKEYTEKSYEISKSVIDNISILKEKDKFVVYSVLIGVAICMIIAFITVTVISVIKDIKKKK